MADDFECMELAIALAEEAAAAGEIPVGAVVADRETGEILAIEEAAKKRGSWRLSGCTLYVTLEPCPMCSGAIINARIDRVVFGAFDEKAGAVSSVQQMFQLPYNHRPRVTEGLLEDRCAAVLQRFFTNLRENS